MAKFRLAALAQLERKYDLSTLIARDAVEQARRENMPGVAARALNLLEYSFIFLKRHDLAEPYLRESVQIAERQELWDAGRQPDETRRGDHEFGPGERRGGGDGAGRTVVPASELRYVSADPDQVEHGFGPIQ